MTRWSPSRRAVLESLADELLHNYGRGRTIIAVDGPDAAGKTTLADDLAVEIRKRRHDVYRASVDDFHRPRELRYRQGRTSPAGYYADAFDYSLLRRVLIEPFRLNGATGFVLAGFDLERDRPLESRWTTGPADAILIVDGVFLQRPELRGMWNAVVYVDVSAAERDRRYLERDGIEPTSELAARYNGAQKLYLKEAKPRESATIVIDNSDPESPHRVFTDSC